MLHLQRCGMLELKRILQNIFNSVEWRNFLKVIDKAKIACEVSREGISYHFVDINKMINLAKGAQREIEDIALKRWKRI